MLFCSLNLSPLIKEISPCKEPPRKQVKCLLELEDNAIISLSEQGSLSDSYCDTNLINFCPTRVSIQTDIPTLSLPNSQVKR